MTRTERFRSARPPKKCTRPLTASPERQPAYRRYQLVLTMTDAWYDEIASGVCARQRARSIEKTKR